MSKLSVRIEMHVDHCDDQGNNRTETGKRIIYHAPPTDNVEAVLFGWYKILQLLTGGGDDANARAAAKAWKDIDVKP